MLAVVLPPQDPDGFDSLVFAFPSEDPSPALLWFD